MFSKRVRRVKHIPSQHPCPKCGARMRPSYSRKLGIRYYCCPRCKHVER